MTKLKQLGKDYKRETNPAIQYDISQEIYKEIGIYKYICGRRLKIRKRIVWKTLKELGFKKRINEKNEYIKYVVKDLRIHIQTKEGGTYFHIDNH